MSGAQVTIKPPAHGSTPFGNVRPSAKTDRFSNRPSPSLSSRRIIRPKGGWPSTGPVGSSRPRYGTPWAPGYAKEWYDRLHPRACCRTKRFQASGSVQDHRALLADGRLTGLGILVECAVSQGSIRAERRDTAATLPGPLIHFSPKYRFGGPTWSAALIEVPTHKARRLAGSATVLVRSTNPPNTYLLRYSTHFLAREPIPKRRFEIDV